MNLTEFILLNYGVNGVFFQWQTGFEVFESEWTLGSFCVNALPLEFSSYFRYPMPLCPSAIVENVYLKSILIHRYWGLNNRPKVVFFYFIKFCCPFGYLHILDAKHLKLSGNAAHMEMICLSSAQIMSPWAPGSEDLCDICVTKNKRAIGQRRIDAAVLCRGGVNLVS